MNKPISVSNLTLDLYLDHVRPAAIAAGIIELTVTEDGKQVYVTDAAAADEIAHCMYCACMRAGNDGIERTHEEYIRHEAERMIYQLTVSVQYDTTHTAETLAPLLAALTEALHPTTPAEAADAELETVADMWRAIHEADAELQRAQDPEHIQAQADAMTWHIPDTDWAAVITAALQGVEL